MTRELTVIDTLAVMPVMDINLAIQRREQIVKFTQAIMVKDTDFGVIPGTNKPTLLKPGAEKLTTFFGLTKKFEIIERTEDWTGKDYAGEPFFYYLYRCQLWRGDMLIAEADGSCSSFESKYRWRKSERVCPGCGQPAIIKGKAEYGGGWICFNKRGGCGAKFPAGDKSIEGQEVGRVPNPDVADQVNTLQKMAQKRALIAATLLAVNASEFFTQDLEDFEFTEASYTVVEETPKEQPKPQQPAKPNSNGAANGKPKAQQPTEKSKPDVFFGLVQDATGNYYKGKEHLYNTIGGWPNFSNQAEIDAKLSAAVDHANEKRQVEAEAKAGEIADDILGIPAEVVEDNVPF